MPDQPMVCAPLDVDVQGVFRGLEGQRVGGGGRDVFACGGVETREEQKPEQQTDHLDEHARPPTNTARFSGGTHRTPTTEETLAVHLAWADAAA
jgi:hypothetical protein